VESDVRLRADVARGEHGAVVEQQQIARRENLIDVHPARSQLRHWQCLFAGGGYCKYRSTHAAELETRRATRPDGAAA